MPCIWRIPSPRQLKSLEAVGKPCQKPFDSDILRIVAFSDYRMQDISLLLDLLKELQPTPNLILYAGDDVERFHSGKENFFEQLAALSTHGLCAVLGNDPPVSCLSWKWRKRSSVKIAERTYEKGTKALPRRGEGSHFEAAPFGQGSGLGLV